MLSTKIYNDALNLAALNCKSAGYHLDDAEALRQCNILIKIMEYGHRHGLTLDTRDRRGGVGLCFKRCEYRPDTLHIEID